MKTKADLIEHLMTIVDDSKSSIEEDLTLVTQSSKKLITELETILFYCKEKSPKKIKEPDFDFLQNELKTVMNKFNEANLKKKFLLNIRDWGHDIISTFDK